MMSLYIEYVTTRIYLGSLEKRVFKMWRRILFKKKSLGNVTVNRLEDNGSYYVE